MFLPLSNKSHSQNRQYLFSMILLVCQLAQVYGYLFNSQKEALISEKIPYQMINYQIPSIDFQNYNSVGFGFWSKYIPQWKPSTYPEIENYEYNIVNGENGQLLIIIEGSNLLKILGFLSLDQESDSILHKYIVETESGQFTLSFPFQSNQYEGIWYFSFITYNQQAQTISIQITNQQKQTVSFGNQQSTFTIHLGARGNIWNQFNLNIFRGRISKLFFSDPFQEETSTFDEFSIQYQIPPLFSEEQAIELIKAQLFNGETIILKEFIHDGNRFFLSGWMKYDFSLIATNSLLPVFRFSVKKNYGNAKLEGDQLIQLKVFFNKDDVKFTFLQFISDVHTFPIQQIYYSEDQLNKFILQNSQDENLYLALNQWHFFRYEYGRQAINNQGLLQLEFFNEVGIIEKVLSGSQLINSAYFVTIGGDDFMNNLLHASIQDFQFFYNYNEDKDLTLKSCHYTCFTCDGPLKDNCLTCKQNSNRIYLSESKTCECLEQYFEEGIECLSFSQQFKSVLEIEQRESEFDVECKFGYFKLPNAFSSHSCIVCPQSSQQDYLCVDCLLNPTEWYLRPICTKDISSYSKNIDDTFSQDIRAEIEFDVYFIDENGLLTLHQEFSDFCNISSDEQCFQSSYFHFGKNPFVKCKPNYYQQNNKCIFSNQFCLNVDQEGKCDKFKQGLYEYFGDFYQCPSKCNVCSFDYQINQIVCLECYENYAIVNGKCQQCGQFCKFCKSFKDENSNDEYLKCFQCIDDSQYFISFDFVNCEKNNIRYCQYAFQADENDITQSTLRSGFPRRTDINNIVTHCGRCQNSYIYVLKSRLCISTNQQNCIYGYIEQFCDAQINDTFLNDISSFGYHYSDSGFNYLGQLDNEYFCLTEQKCLIQQSLGAALDAIQYFAECSTKIIHCSSCLMGKSSWLAPSTICLTCDSGYYASKILGQCFTCPQELNCFQCYQQQRLYQDQWKNEIRAFYRKFIELDNQHPYLLNAQSQDINDYEIKCSVCLKGYELYKNNCIKACPSSCLECKIVDGKNICIQCLETQQGRTLSLSNNECIECPSDCALCRIRSDEEIKEINPLFSNEIYIQNTYQCLKSFNNQDLYYDQELGTFIECQQSEQCFKQFKISLRLYCNYQSYENQYNQQLNQADQLKFKQQNIFIDDLVSGNSFQQFENEHFYFQANQRKIKLIEIEIKSDFEQICQINGDGVIQQQFSQNIFTTKNVQLKFIANQKTIIQYAKSISFVNFNHIIIQGLIFQPQDNFFEKQINFQSVLQQTVELNQLIYEQKYTSLDNSLLKFNNVEKLIISEFEILNLQLTKVNNFIIINESTFKKSISIAKLKINNSKFIDLIFILFHLNNDDNIEFNDIIVNSIFQNSTFISTQGNYNSGSLFLNNSQLGIQIYNSLFFDFIKLKTLEIENMLFQKSTIQNSQLLLLNNLAKIQNFSVINCNFQGISQVLFNSEILSYIPLFYQLEILSFADNQYQQNTKFIATQRYSNQNSQANLKNLQITNNFNFEISQDFNIKSKISSLFYFEIDYLLIDVLNIERGYGLREISIIEIENLTLINVKISQGNQFRFLGLHQYVDCQLQSVNGTYYLQSIFIQSVKNLLINELQIKKVQSYNSPIISYQSAQASLQEQFELLEFSNIIVEDNLLLITQSQSSSSIFHIFSEQKTQIKFQNVKFRRNLLNEYIQDQLSPSALLLFIDCYLGDINVSQGQFFANSVFNSTDNIIDIRSNTLNINDCEFDKNSIFDYQILQPYILWGFSINDKLYIEDIQEIFQIFSISGNGIFKAQNISMLDCIVSNSKGSMGGGFLFVGQKDSVLFIQNLKFSKISTYFQNELEIGGCIYIDGTGVSSLFINVLNITATQIYSRYQGGVLYIDAANNKIKLDINNIHAVDVFSQLGSILYIDSTKQTNQLSDIKINGIEGQFTEAGYLKFLDQFYSASISSLEQGRLTNNMSLINIQNSAKIQVMNLKLEQVFQQSIIQVDNFIQITIVNVTTSNNQFSKNLMSLHPNQFIQHQILLKNISVYDSNIGVKSLNSPDIQSPQKKVYTSHTFKCLTKSQSIMSPKKLEYLNLNQNRSFGYYQQKLLVNEIDKTSLNLFQLLQLNNLTQIKMDDIHLINIECSECNFGLIWFNFQESNILQKQLISNIWIKNSSCGNLGCLIILNKPNNQQRLLSDENYYLQLLNLEFIINHYSCFNNNGRFGTCLFVYNIRILVDKSNFQKNKANEFGGAIYAQNNNKELIITNSFISQNSAKVGGGIYLENCTQLNYKSLKTIIENNSAIEFGDEISSLPEKLTIEFGRLFNYLNREIDLKTINRQIDSIQIDPFVSIFGQSSNYIMMPSGQKISDYQVFDWKTGESRKIDQIFRIVALNREGEVMKNLSNSYCKIGSRSFNVSFNKKLNGEQQFPFTNNYTNVEQVFFNTITQDYNLDDLIIYFESELSSEIVLQLEFNCSSVKIPITNDKFPYNIKGYHSNYSLRVNIKTYSCQFGEIKNLTNFSCLPCDSTQGQFSLVKNSNKCQIKDDITTIAVQSAKLNLRAGYWRPYFDSSEIHYCLNLVQNCLGGWIPGDSSCYLGHIGALCEQCDLYNIRGDGEFSLSEKYSCGSCLEKDRNAILISFVSLWTLVSILISVQSTLRAIEELVRIINIMLLGLAVSQGGNQSAILIKILTNYFQIISSISTFELSLPSSLISAINTVGSPIQAVTYSLDCFLKDMFQFEIHYGRIVWQLIMPIIYMTAFFIFYFIGTKLKLLIFNKSVITTAFIYIYIYLQPSLIGGIIELLSYRDISNFSWISANVAFRYDSQTHTQWMLKFCIPVLTVLGLVIPLFLFYGLYSNQAYLDDKQIRLQWGYLYNEYKKTAFFWEIVKVLQKEFMIIFLTYYAENIIIKASIMTLILIIYLELNQRYSPYSLNYLNKLDHDAMNVCAKSMILAIGIFVSQQSSIKEIQIIYLLILALINLYFIISLVFKILKEYLNEKYSNYEEKLDKLRDLIRTKLPFTSNIPFMKKFLTNRKEQLKRIKERFKKLKEFLIPQAKDIISLKNQRLFSQIDKLQDENQDGLPHSLMSPGLPTERQKFIRKTINEKSMNLSKQTITSYVLDNLKLKQSTQLPSINEIGKVKQTQVKPIEQDN